jgi:hypothetical protein
MVYVVHGVGPEKLISRRFVYDAYAGQEVHRIPGREAQRGARRGDLAGA